MYMQAADALLGISQFYQRIQTGDRVVANHQIAIEYSRIAIEKAEHIKSRLKSSMPTVPASAVKTPGATDLARSVGSWSSTVGNPDQAIEVASVDLIAPSVSPMGSLPSA